MEGIKEKLDTIRMPEQKTKKETVLAAALAFLLGIALGILSKWLDNLALDSTIWWHRAVETLDLGNFFSEIAVWLLLALIIAVFSASALRAALNVFAFFFGMCAAYHLYSILFSGFDPSSYMMIWYGITLASPFLAVLCWYAKGSGAAAVVLDIGIIAVFLLSCFAVGLVYIGWKGILYLPVFIAAVIILYRNPKQLLISVPAGIALAFLLSPAWPFK